MELVKYDAMEWVASARKEYSKPARESCQVCGSHKSISHAHHVVPLATQFELGYETPSHDIAWLCPNHHAYIHRLMGKRNHADAITEIGLDNLRKLMTIMGVDTNADS